MALAKHLLIQNALTVFKRAFSSALYITGDKAHNTFSVVVPILDFEERLRNKSELETNLKLRRLNIDLNRLEKQWHFYKHFDDQKTVLEITKSEIGKKIVQLMKDRGKEDETIEKLKLQGKLVKDDLRTLRDYLYGIEETAALNVLSLPNILHQNTPPGEEVVIHTYLDKLSTKPKSHMDIGKEEGLIEFTNPFFYFLKGEAALFELAITNYISQKLLDSSFTQFSNSDFCRSVVVEGCGTNFMDKLQILTLEEIHNETHHEYSHLHLTGGASLYSFMAYFTKHMVQPSYFPLRFFATGRKYQPITFNNDNGASLFNVHQESALEIFVATKDDDEEIEKELRHLIAQIIEIYEPLGRHFRLVYLPANKLKNHESLHVSIQMYSAYLQSYIEVGHCSVCDSYLSKRLMFVYSVNKEWKFPKVISGTLLRVQPLLGCLLECKKENLLLLNDELKSYVLLD